MAIYKYDFKRQYKPNELKNKVRRMQQVPLEMSYQKRLISNQVLLFLMKLPVIKFTLKLINSKIGKLLKQDDFKQICKEDVKC